MRFTGQVKKIKNRGSHFDPGWALFLFFPSDVVMVTAAAGHFRTQCLAIKKHLQGLFSIREPTMGI